MLSGFMGITKIAQIKDDLHLGSICMGSIGHLMAGSGLQEGLELVYADNAVVHMQEARH